jgi:putative ABC transport system ATP-binding protein
MRIHLENIAYSYARREVLRDIHLDAKAGEWIAFYWVSGSGKTTLLRILGTLLRARSWRYAIDGDDIYSFSLRELRRLRKNRFWYIFSDHHFVEDLSARENILLSYRLSGTPFDTDRLDSLVTTLDMWSYMDQRVMNLSTWQRDRMAVIAWLIHTPDCIIIDEPWSSLHEDMRIKLYEILARERDRWAIILSASHDPLLRVHTTASFTLYDSTLHSFTSPA